MSLSKEELQYPQPAIQTAVQDVVTKLHKADWQPRVVRQNKLLKVGSLDFIDYAIPCHELSNRLSTAPRELAAVIAEELNKMSTFKADFTAEAIEGYVNIQLSDQFLDKSLTKALQWYKSPQAFNQKLKSIRYLVVGINIVQQDGIGTTDEAYQYLSKLYATLGITSEAEYIIGDYSDILIDRLYTELVASDKVYENAQNKHRFLQHREIKDFLSDSSQLNSSTRLGKIFFRIRAEWLKVREKYLEKIDVVDYAILFESEIHKKVHEYLDALPSHVSEIGIIRDEASQAAYYVGENEVVPLRSAEGILCTAAYILFVIDKEVTSLDENNSLVVVGSHRLNLLISDHLRSLVSDFKHNSRVIYFDPRVAKADITEMRTKVPHLGDFFLDINNSLNNQKNQKYDNQQKRHALLNLIDLPIEINTLASRMQFAALFDCINQATDSNSFLKS